MINEHLADQQETGIAELEKEYRADPDIVAESLGDFSNDAEAKTLLMRLQHATGYHFTELAIEIAKLHIAHIDEYIAFQAHENYFKQPQKDKFDDLVELNGEFI